MTDKPRISAREIRGRDPEVTPLGYWLRRFKLDELPQLYNVIKGQMSIVGPRPALPTRISSSDQLETRRLLVRPGLTGLAQINGNINLSWPERWRYDAQYVERVSLKLDLYILFRTVGVVLLGEDRFISHPEPVGPNRSAAIDREVSG
jgi:lipopolysaccharide/colanic/teichoic acid biosynthesis glycosyltransferase